MPTARMPFGLVVDLDIGGQGDAEDISFVDFLDHVKLEAITEEGESEGIIRFEPWDYLMERAEAWEKGASETILKGRQLGFTWLAAAYALWHVRRRGKRVLYIADTDKKAKMFLDRVKLIEENLPRFLRQDIRRNTASELVMRRGGEILALPSSSRQGRGWTASLVIFDEAAIHQHAAENFRGIRNTVADGGQFICMSTSAGPAGWFYDRYQQQKEYGATVFVEWFRRPGRDAEWYERERKEWTSEADFAAENPATEEEAFRPPEGLVLPEFDYEKHTGDTNPIAYEDCMWRLAGYDPGGDDPTSVGIYGFGRLPNGQFRFIQYHHFYKRNQAVPVSDVANYIWAWHRRAPIFGIAVGTRPKSETIAELHKLGLRQARGMKGNPAERNRVHAMFIKNNWLFINRKTCPEAIKEYAHYRKRMRTDPNTREEYATATPVDNHADGIDERGMAMQLLWAAVRAVGGVQKHQLNYHKRDQPRNRVGKPKTWGDILKRRR